MQKTKTATIKLLPQGVNTGQQANEILTLINRWILYCRSEGMSAKTIEDYERRIEKFYWWFEDYAHLDEKIGTHPKDFTEDHIREYLLYLRAEVAFRWGEPVIKGKQTLSSSTVFNYVRVVRTFFNWLEGRHIIDKSPFSKHVSLTTRTDPVRKRHYSNLQESDLNQLFSFLTKKDYMTKYTGARNLAMISVLLDSGMRLGELLSMRVCDIEWERKRINIRGKTGPRTCFFSRAAQEAMDNYHYGFRRLQERHLQPNDKYWLCRNGRVLTEGGFSTMVSEVCKDSGVRFHAHQLRHTFASMMIKRVSVYEVKELLGHTDINTTMIYAHGSTDANQLSHQGNSPLSVLDLGQTIRSKKKKKPSY